MKLTIDTNKLSGIHVSLTAEEVIAQLRRLMHAEDLHEKDGCVYRGESFLSNGTEDAELYTRYVQLGVYSPIFRFSSKEGRYYKREPWKWDVKTQGIVKDYTRVRHRLIPYIYSEAYKYSKYGINLIKPLYYDYKETIDEPLYKNEYHFGSELFVCPITEPKDKVMNRVLHRIYLPEGTWYDFKTGKKFPGGKRYVTFYKDEDYPVYAKSGSIIPLAIIDENNINSVLPPKKMEIQVFPGVSNNINLYEDDGISSLYKEGYYILTNIDYNYRKNNYTLILRPIEGKTGIVPDKRDYKIKFRNTKRPEYVKVNVGRFEVEFTTRCDESDFIIEIPNVPTNQQLTVNCGGEAIEIDAVRLINEDIDEIISDLQIETNLKEQVASILFSDLSIKKKRIDYRRRQDYVATYEKCPDGSYDVTMKIVEPTKTTLEIKFNVMTRNIAKYIERTWQEKAASVYGKISDTLID